MKHEITLTEADLYEIIMQRVNKRVSLTYSTNPDNQPDPEMFTGMSLHGGAFIDPTSHSLAVEVIVYDDLGSDDEIIKRKLSDG